MNKFYFILFFAVKKENMHKLRLRNYSSKIGCTGNAASVNLKYPIIQIFGANTDVGKTLVSTGLTNMATNKYDRNCHYVKPLQTGTEWDVTFMQRYATSKQLTCDTLFSYEKPVSPHLAENKWSDGELVQRLVASMDNDHFDFTVVETAGGVCTPTPNCTPQIDAYRPLRLPNVLVGDGKLGGISATLSALDSILLRGCDIDAIAMLENFIEDEKLENYKAVAQFVLDNKLDIKVFPFVGIPKDKSIGLENWFLQSEEQFDALYNWIVDQHRQRILKLENLENDTLKNVWWPFTQHSGHKHTTIIDSAYGNHFATFENQKIKPMFDACASWWTQGIGHGNPQMARSLAYTAGRYGHVMFPQNAHEPAAQVAKKIVNTVGKGWAERVFFSDNGSTAVEVAIKMAFRKYLVDHDLPIDSNPSTMQLVILAQQNCYHGDTLGTMHVAEPSTFNSKQHAWYRDDAATFVHFSSIECVNGQYQVQWMDADRKDVFQKSFENKSDVWDLSKRLSTDEKLVAAYRAYVQKELSKFEQNQDRIPKKIGAVLIEPILIGAGGMMIVDPLFQRVLVEECRASKIPVIYDEVFSGFWRLGKESGRDILGIHPDIACYAKLLTGGTIPLSTTVASKEVFDSFMKHQSKSDALLHGHSFTANPVGCAAVLHSMRQYEENAGQWDIDSYWNDEVVRRISKMSIVRRTGSIGTVLIVELKSNASGYDASSATMDQTVSKLRHEGLFVRALGNVIYIMASPLTLRDECDYLMSKLESSLSK